MQYGVIQLEDKAVKFIEIRNRYILLGSAGDLIHRSCKRVFNGENLQCYVGAKEN